MVAASSFPETPADLPARTWRQWWKQSPRWLWIGLSAVFVVLLMHLVLILLIAIRIREPEPIRTLRSHGHNVNFPWDHGPPDSPNPPFRILSDIHHGRTCANIQQMGLNHPTDADLAICGRYFPNLTGLWVTVGDEVSQEGLRELLKCRNLYRLDLSGPAVDDDLVKHVAELKQLRSLGLSGTLITDASVAMLAELKQLSNLDLSGTLITDASVATLQKMPQLSEANLECTHVSQAACEAWHARVPGYQGTPGAPALRSDYHPLNLESYGSKLVVRWQNNQLTDLANYNSLSTLGRGRFISLQADGPLPGDSERFEHDFGGMYRLIFKSDGEYRLMLKVDDVESEPVTARAVGGKLISPSRVEFRMPVTNAEAMKSVPK